MELATTAKELSRVERRIDLELDTNRHLTYALLKQTGETKPV